MSAEAATRLAVYGTLKRGMSNHHHLATLAGTWTAGTVRGHLHPLGWGAALGFPALVLDEAGAEVEVDLLESDALPAHWARLDEFEGAEYERVVARVACADGVTRLAQLYAALDVEG